MRENTRLFGRFFAFAAACAFALACACAAVCAAPQSAYAGGGEGSTPEPFDIWVYGVRVSTDNMNDIFDDGANPRAWFRDYWNSSTESHSYILYLNDCQPGEPEESNGLPRGAGDGFYNVYGIYSDLQNLTIVYEGTNSVDVNFPLAEKAFTTYGLYSAGNVTITGSDLASTLKFNVGSSSIYGSYGIYVGGNLVLNGDGAVSGTAGEVTSPEYSTPGEPLIPESVGVQAANITVGVKDSTQVTYLNAYAGKRTYSSVAGIFATNKLTLTNKASVVANCPKTAQYSSGVLADDIEIAGYLEAVSAACEGGKGRGVWARESLTVAAEGTLKATGGDTPTSYGICCEGPFDIYGGVVKGFSNNMYSSSYGIYLDGSDAVLRIKGVTDLDFTLKAVQAINKAPDAYGTPVQFFGCGTENDFIHEQWSFVSGNSPKSADLLACPYMRAKAVGPINISGSGDLVVLDGASSVYSGKPIYPTCDVSGLYAAGPSGSSDFAVTYENNVSAGTGKVIVTGTGNFTGTIVKEFQIAPQSLSGGKVTVGTKTYAYSGTAKTPAVTVKNANGTVLKKNTDYTVKYSSNTAIGTAKATVTGKGNYKGSLSATFTINPAKTAIKSLAKGTKSFKVTWVPKTKAAAATGYQIRYSTKSTMASPKTVTVTSYKTKTKTVKSLKANKKYYVQIRTYKTVSGKKYYSAWSAKKSVTTK